MEAESNDYVSAGCTGWKLSLRITCRRAILTRFCLRIKCQSEALDRG